MGGTEPPDLTARIRQSLTVGCVVWSGLEKRHVDLTGRDGMGSQPVDGVGRRQRRLPTRVGDSGPDLLLLVTFLACSSKF